MNPKRSADPAAEPVSRELAKSYLRVDSTTDDDLIDFLIKTAREYVEDYTGETLIQTTWIWNLLDWSNSRIVRPQGQWYDWNTDSPGILYVPMSPLVSVTSIKYYDTAGTLQTLDAANYQLDTYTNPGRIMPATGYVWPDIESDNLSAIEVKYVAGYGTEGDNIPSQYRLAMLYLLTLWYEERKPVAFVQANKIPHTITDLLGMPRYG